MPDTVLVTGGTGYVAGWCIVSLLERGYDVRTTVRNLDRSAGVRAAIEHETSVGNSLSFVTADLGSDDGWDDAAAGCAYVLHVASPMSSSRDEQSVVGPAVEGVERVLRAARDAGARRVVYTSTCGAIYYGHPERAEPFDERDWTNVDAGGMSTYVKSKALAERAAWDFVERDGGSLEFTTVNPTGIFGPALSLESASSLRLIDRLLSGKPPICPDLWFSVVDVRDVADLHLRAMTDSAAAGERFIANSGPPISMLDIARTLRDELGDQASKVPTRKAPDWLVRFAGRFNNELGSLVPLLGHRRNASAAKAQRVLGWVSRPWQATVLDSARSLAALHRADGGSA